MGQPVNPVWVSGHYRFENDDGTLDGSSFIAAEDTTITQVVDTNFRLRINWGESAGQNQGDVLDAALQFRINSGTWTTVTASTGIQYASSSNETDGNTSTTERLTTPPTGVATYVESEFDSNNTTTSNAPVDQYYEDSFNIYIDSVQVANNDVIDFQLIDGSGVETFATIDTVPSLTASITGTHIDTGTQALTLTNYASTIKFDTNVNAGINALTLNEQQATIGLSKNISATTDSLTLTNFKSNVNAAKNIATNLNALNLTTFQAGVTVGGDTEVIASVDNLTLTEYLADIKVDANVNANINTLTLTTYVATISTGNDVVINANVHALSLTSYQSSIEVKQTNNGSGGYYKRNSTRTLHTFDYYEKLAKKLIEKEKQEEQKIEKLEKELNDKQITILLNKDPEFDNLQSQKKIASAQVKIIEIKSKIIKSQKVLSVIEQKLNEAKRLAEIIKDDDMFLKHYLKVS